MSYGKLALICLACALFGAAVAWADWLTGRRLIGPVLIAVFLAVVSYYQWLDASGISLTLYGVRASLMSMIVGAPGLVAIIGYVIGAGLLAGLVGRRSAR